MEPPRKRARLGELEKSTTEAAQPQRAVKMDNGNQDTAIQMEKEAQVGITQFVDKINVGFEGVLKQRYTDFLVNEITPDGQVVHLTDDSIPKLKNIARNVAASATPQNSETSSSVIVSADTSQHPSTEATDDIKTTESTVSAEPESVIRAEEHAEIAEVKSFAISKDDVDLLIEYFTEPLKDEIVELHAKILSKPTAKPASFGFLLTEQINDRVLRGRIHGDVRRIFAAKLDTEVVDQGIIKISAAPPVKPHPEGSNRRPANLEGGRAHPRPGQAKGKLGWQELGGEYLHFSLYKENKDTMEVISYLSRLLRTGPKDFGFAGTKDRRAVTVQRVSVFRQHADRLARANKDLRQARIGNFKYGKHKLELGELLGNQFIITLRDCHFGDDAELDDVARVVLGERIVGLAIQHLQTHGFINYFGLQRFGTFGVGTDDIGKNILRGDFKGAVDGILQFNEMTLEVALQDRDPLLTRINRDDLDRTYAIWKFRESGKSQPALNSLPRKFSAENALIRHLGQNGTDYLGALLQVPRNLRLMYVHAYQSLVWNVVASERWSRYGSKVIKGDLVIIDNLAEKAAGKQAEVDENGEIIVLPAADDYAITHDDIYERARAITAEEAESGKYSIFDIVLPTPGYDIEYPDNDVGDFYKEFMESERGGGLDPGKMRRSQKDFSLSGSYRKLLGQVKDLTFEVKGYRKETEQLVETDLEKINRLKPRRDQQDRQGNDRGGYIDHGRGFGNRARGGRQNNFFNAKNNHGRREQYEPQAETGNGRFNQDRDIRLLDAERVKNTDSSVPAIDPKLRAWQALPQKLAQDDKTAQKRFELEKLTAEPTNLDEIQQPIYQETFIETSPGKEGRRTGHRTTKVVRGEVSKKDINDVFFTQGTVPAISLAETQTKKYDDEANVLSSFDGVDERDYDDGQDEGGVMLKLGLQMTPKDSAAVIEEETTQKQSPMKRAAEQISGEKILEGDTPRPEKAAKMSLNPTARSLTPPVGDAKQVDSTSPPGQVSSPTSSLKVSSPVLIPSLPKGEELDLPSEEWLQKNCEEAEPETAKVAVILKFSLGTSQYATMALRELMKAGGVKTYKPDFSSSVR